MDMSMPWEALPRQPMARTRPRETLLKPLSLMEGKWRARKDSNL
jgi:hypothetical protein